MSLRPWSRPVRWLLPFLLGGCSVGPNYQGPPASDAPTTPADYKNQQGKWKVAAPSDAVFRGEWWKVFRDATLDRMVAQALAGNQDLRGAVARIAEARALNKVAAADFYPHLEAMGSGERDRTSNTLPIQRAELVGANPFAGAGAGAAGGAGPESGPLVLASQPLSTTQDLFRAPVDLDWEVDVFGRVRRGYEASRADRQAIVADARNIALSVAANVTVDYFALRALDSESDILEATVRSQRQALGIAQERLEAGLTSELDVTRAQAELANEQADVQSVARTRNEVEDALATLMGEAASGLRVGPQPFSANVAPPGIPAGLPGALLERRPDVAAAERELAAANARIGVAVAAFFPVVKITGAAGFESVDLGTLFSWESRIWQIGPSISLPIFEGGRNYANLKASQARYDESVAKYRAQVLVAFREVEDALGDLRTLAAQAGAQSRAVAAEARALELARQQYEKGTTAFLDVLDAQRALLRDQRVAAQLQGQRLQATVRLIKALGGGWGEQ